MHAKQNLLIGTIITFSLGILVGQLVPVNVFRRKPANAITRVRQSGFTYIKPLLRCETPSTVEIKALKDLSDELKTYVTQSEQQNVAEDISVYFSDTISGSWFAINGEKTYTPASLLKVPIMMMYFKEAASNSAILSQTAIYGGGDGNLMSHYKPSIPLEINRAYSADDLIVKMITESDNNAKDMLLANFKQGNLAQVLEELSLPLTFFEEQEDTYDVGTYAAYFRTLYSATYLNRYYSERALAILSQSKFSKGLVAGVPQDVSVAHKFGERTQDGTTRRQLHDCGVIYYPDSPYILCVMTRGNSFDKLEQVIATISAKSYQAVDHWRKNQVDNP